MERTLLSSEEGERVPQGDQKQLNCLEPREEKADTEWPREVSGASPP
jgi:hypothetical protein